MENTTTPVAQGNSTKALMQALNSLPARDIAMHAGLEAKFIQLFQQMHRVSAAEAEGIFHQERFHFMKVISDNASLRECEGLSIYGCWMDVAANKLSFDPSKKLAYIIPSNVNVGTRETPHWVKRATMVVSPYGELAQRQMDGQIKYADNPVIVYEGDTFEPFVGEDGVKKVKYALSVNHTKTIVGAFIRIVRTDGSTDLHWLLKDDIERLKGYSEKKNRSAANALYSSFNGQIDPGFLAAKMIKHAFKSYPKVKVRGQFTKVETEIIDENAVDYGFEIKPGVEQQHITPHTEVTPSQPQSHAAKEAILNATANEEEGKAGSFTDDSESETF